jgi:hypothetical protein
MTGPTQRGALESTLGESNDGQQAFLLLEPERGWRMVVTRLADGLVEKKRGRMIMWRHERWLKCLALKRVSKKLTLIAAGWLRRQMTNDFLRD